MRSYLSLVKFSHTIFAMPFAMVGLFLGFRTVSTDLNAWPLIFKVVLCMIFARNAAMAFNRWADKRIDAANPRTAVREIPAGVIKADHVLYFVIINCLLFAITTAFINSMCLMLSPVALLVVLGYSYTKRFTALSHFVLGLGLSLAPVGAYLAVTGAFDLLPILYGVAVFFWVAGFDIIYSLQDQSFDEQTGLHSIPSLLGAERALMVSRFAHLFTAVALCFAGFLLSSTYTQMDLWHWIAVGVFVLLLIYQQSLVRPNRLDRVNLAFFTTNGVASVLFGMLLIIDFWY